LKQFSLKASKVFTALKVNSETFFCIRGVRKVPLESPRVGAEHGITVQLSVSLRNKSNAENVSSFFSFLLKLVGAIFLQKFIMKCRRTGQIRVFIYHALYKLEK